jgi:Cell wall-active antibiotics response 4TMS YvqF
MPRAPHPTVGAELVPERRGMVTFLSSVRREGDWIVPRLLRVVSFMGNAELDLTRALLASGTSQIEVKCVLGSITIIVPPDLRLECEVDAVLGSAEVVRGAPSATTPDAPTVRVTGTSFLGSVEVKIVDPDAPGWFGKLRKRLAKET